MGYASKLAQSYSNPESVWNSLGAVGSTSAWGPSSADLTAFRGILSYAKKANQNKINQDRVQNPNTYRPSGPSKYGMFGTNAFETAKTLAEKDPVAVANAIAGKYLGRFDKYFL